MKKFCNFFLFLTFVISASAQDIEYYKKIHCQMYFNESYGEFDRNKFDIIVPKSNAPVPLVIFIHGGGFLYGDKKDFYYRDEDIQYFLENNIAIATINYRFFKPDDSLGVKICISDVKRALQYIKHNNKKYNIDKSLIGSYGISAGAGSSLYLAFHNDMAISGDTSLLGESTRIKCAGAISTQSTYNVFRWQKIIPWMRLVVLLKRKVFYNAAANFYGFPDYKSFKKYKKDITASLDMLDMINNQSPPVYLMNLLDENFPKNDNVIQHHKKHAIAVSKKFKKYNIKNYVFTDKQAKQEKDIKYQIKEFFVDKLK